ncbi:MAG: hypothetical protein LBS27_11345 [Bifidobacteriaceae bacterium]|nr:hypothetical protein [Bifidobacteriaceae bacterium]
MADDDGVGDGVVTVGAVFAGPDADPECFASRNRGVVEAAVADTIRGLAGSGGRPAGAPVGDGPAAWSDAAEAWGSGVWSEIADLRVAGLGADGGVVWVAAVVDGSRDVRLLAAAGQEELLGMVAEALDEGLASRRAGVDAEAFTAVHGPPPGRLGALIAWVDAHQRALGRPAVTFGAVPVAAAPPPAGDAPVAGTGPAGGTVVVEMPAVWADLSGSPVAVMVSEAFREAPARAGFPAGPDGDGLWEEEMEAWRGECLELASAVANLPDILDRLDLLEHQNSVLARRLAADPLPERPRTAGGWRGLGAWVGEFVSAAARREEAVARWRDAVRQTPQTALGMRDLVEDQARALAAALADLSAPGGAGGRSLAERGLDRAGRDEVARLFASGRAAVEVGGFAGAEFDCRGGGGRAWERLEPGWYEAAALDGAAPAAVVVGRDPRGGGGLVSGAYKLDTATVALLAPVRRLAADAARNTATTEGPQARPRAARPATLAPLDVFGRAPDACGRQAGGLGL